MKDQGQGTDEAIEAVSAEQPIALSWTPSTEESHLDIDLSAQVDEAMAGEAARQLVSDNFDGFDRLASQVAGTQSDDWDADAHMRVEAGTSDAISDDELFQSSDWDQASGRDDNPLADLIGN